MEIAFVVIVMVGIYMLYKSGPSHPSKERLKDWLDRIGQLIH